MDLARFLLNSLVMLPIMRERPDSRLTKVRISGESSGFVAAYSINLQHARLWWVAYSVDHGDLQLLEEEEEEEEEDNGVGRVANPPRPPTCVSYGNYADLQLTSKLKDSTANMLSPPCVHRVTQASRVATHLKDKQQHRVNHLSLVTSKGIFLALTRSNLVKAPKNSVLIMLLLQDRVRLSLSEVKIGRFGEKGKKAAAQLTPEELATIWQLCTGWTQEVGKVVFHLQNESQHVWSPCRKRINAAVPQLRRDTFFF